MCGEVGCPGMIKESLFRERGQNTRPNHATNMIQEKIRLCKSSVEKFFQRQEHRQPCILPPLCSTFKKKVCGKSVSGRMQREWQKAFKLIISYRHAL